MTEKTKSKITAVVDGTKHQAWKWLGALIMKPKTNAAGETHLAVSWEKLQKLVTIVMAVVLFVTMLIFWIVKAQVSAETGVVIDPIPDSMLNTLWGLLGLTGVNMAAGAVFKKQSGGESQ